MRSHPHHEDTEEQRDLTTGAWCGLGHRGAEHEHRQATRGGSLRGGYTGGAGGAGRPSGASMAQAGMGPMGGYSHQIAGGSTFQRGVPSGAEHSFGHQGTYSGTPAPHDERGFGGHGERSLRSFRGRGPKGYARSDERIKEDVCECLSDSALVDAGDIEVSVQSGEVTLHGTVPSRRMRREAEDVAETVRGVHNVQNDLRVAAGRAS